MAEIKPRHVAAAEQWMARTHPFEYDSTAEEIAYAQGMADGEEGEGGGCMACGWAKPRHPATNEEPPIVRGALDAQANAERKAGAARKDRQDLAEAVLAYDRAVESCANDPRKMASYCTAQGTTLDGLYFAMVKLAHFSGSSGSIPTLRSSVRR